VFFRASNYALGASMEIGRERGARVARIGAAFFWGALFVGLYDLARAAYAPATDFESMRDLLRLLPRSLIFWPALLASAAAAWALPCDLLAGKIRGPLGGLALGGVAAAPILPLLVSLVSGPAIASSPLRFPLMVVAFAAVAVAVALWTRLVGRVAQSVRDRRGWARGAAAFAVLAAAGIGMAALDAITVRVLPGLYEPFHRLAGLAAVALCAGGAWVALSTRAARWTPRRVVACLGAACAAGAILAFAVGGNAPLGRQLLAERAPFFGPFQGVLNRAQDRLTWALADAVEPAARDGRGAVHTRVRFPSGAAHRTVLLVTVDALRADAVEPGRPLAASAPRLVGLGRGALRFSRAYSPGNKTPIAVPGIVLGALPVGDGPPALADSLASPFDRAGYETHFFFTSHEYANLEPTPLWPLASRGFGFRAYHREYLAAPEILSRAGRVLDRPGAPRFVWVHLSDLHHPFLLGGAGQGDPLAEAYPRALAELDGVLAPFLDRFRKENPDAIWALSSDHGESLGERGVSFHGSSLFDEQIRVPLLLGGPGTSSGLVERPVGLAALGATLAVLAGAEAEPDVPLLPLPNAFARRRFAPVLSAGIDACAWIDFPYKLVADPGKGTLALYDLERDPAESRNLIAERRERAEALMAALLRGGCPYDLNALSAAMIQ
jgi:hypothetical protein